MSILLIDGDPIVYRCGFAAEKHSYHVVYEKAEGQVDEIWFHPKEKISAGDQMKAWQVTAETLDCIVLDKTKIVEAQPESFAIQALYTQMDSILAEVGKVAEVKIFLSGKTNYRYAIAQQRPYKGTRLADKPVHYQLLRDELADHYHASIVSGIEADDYISTLARVRKDPIVATIDKDLDQIPGKHYNYMKKVLYDVDPVEAELFFYEQCISGDLTDNIPGCYKVGLQGAHKRVYDAFAEAGEFRAVWDTVLDTYALSKERQGCPYADGDSRAVALETARLVKLQEREGQLWTPPGEPLEVIPEEWYERSK